MTVSQRCFSVMLLLGRLLQGLLVSCRYHGTGVIGATYVVTYRHCTKRPLTRAEAFPIIVKVYKAHETLLVRPCALETLSYWGILLMHTQDNASTSSRQCYTKGLCAGRYRRKQHKRPDLRHFG